MAGAAIAAAIALHPTPTYAQGDPAACPDGTEDVECYNLVEQQLAAFSDPDDECECVYVPIPYGVCSISTDLIRQVVVLEYC